MKTNTLKEHIRLLRLAIELGDTWEQYRLIHAYKFDNENAYPKDDDFIIERAEERYLETGRRWPA